MEIFAQGTDVILDVYMYDREGGDLIDPDNYPATEPTVSVIDQNGVTKVSNELVSQDYADGKGRVGIGHYSMKYTLAEDAPIGTQWRFIWSMTLNGAVLPEAERTEYFEVVEAGYVSFAGYITVSEIREYMEGMGIDSTTLTDAFIQKRISAEIAKVERLVNKSLFTLKSEEIIMSGDGSKTIQLPHWPVESLTSVEILYGGEYENQAVIDSDMVLNGRLGQVSILSAIIQGVERIFRFPEGQNNIRVNYRHGYSTVPTEVKEAIIQRIVARCLNQVSSRDGGVSSLSVEGYSKTYNGGGQYQGFIKSLRADAKNVLKGYWQVV